MPGRPYFLWDLDVTAAELRERLRHPDPKIRAQWQGRLMREARPDEVWHWMSLEEVLRDLAAIQPHLGRKRRFWTFLIDGWRADGLARRNGDECIVDLVIDRAPMVQPEKARFGQARVDTLREIAANKICTLLGRSEIKDLVDLRVLLETGTSLAQALADAEIKEAGAEPATLAWVLDELRIAPEAPLPGGTDAVALDEFRRQLVKQLRALAFDRARR